MKMNDKGEIIITISICEDKPGDQSLSRLVELACLDKKGDLNDHISHIHIHFVFWFFFFYL